MHSRGSRHSHHLSCGVHPASRYEGTFTSASLILVLLLSSSAFMLPDRFLMTLCACNFVLVLHGVYRKGSVTVLVKVFSVQLAITMALYYLLHGQEQMLQGLLAVLRVLLAFIPGWWLSVTCAPEKIGRVLTWILPAKWAFVITASIGLLPLMGKEMRDIYQAQCLRGARITPKALRDPRNWHELVSCVLLPLLIQLLKLSKQMATAAQFRYYGTNDKPTYWKF